MMQAKFNTNSEDPDQSAPQRVVKSGSALFAQACNQPKNSGSFKVWRICLHRVILF